jgi:hypothetical protein
MKSLLLSLSLCAALGGCASYVAPGYGAYPAYPYSAYPAYPSATYGYPYGYPYAGSPGYLYGPSIGLSIYGGYGGYDGGHRHRDGHWQGQRDRSTHGDHGHAHPRGDHDGAHRRR